MTRDATAALGTVLDLVAAAGRLLHERLGAAGAAEAKGGTEFVTDMDRRSEELLLSGLEASFPDDAVVAEESGDHAGASGRTWYVDPLDGTTNYAHGHPFFAVSAACIDADGPWLGVVHAPALGATYHAVRGGGAHLHRAGEDAPRRLGPLAERPLRSALLATGFPYVRDEVVDRNVRLVRDFLRAPCQGLRRDGSAALDLAHVAAGVLDGYWEFGLRPWDTAAGVLVAREAGALVTACDGRAEPLPWRDVLAAAPGVHAAMLAVLARAGEEP